MDPAGEADGLAHVVLGQRGAGVRAVGVHVGSPLEAAGKLGADTPRGGAEVKGMGG
ncbi:hypothetical protein Ga0080559_TMP1701 [Salipiger profundus]|uniref:Uncharacterized protein n=1 Tax=Salipiger profundus TaxID=1229727 RepID=A0A1U7D2V6_9RHOB|nr:hypothetical protein Ga0080559_TMP1701 [Salipiger profundus]